MLKLISNIVGKLGVSLLMFMSAPWLLKALGPEQYGAVGIYIAVQMVLMLVDGGFSVSYTRALSKISPNDQLRREQIASYYFSLFFKLSLVVVVLACILFLLIIKSEENHSTTSFVMAVSLAGQFLMIFYQATYSSIGLQTKYNGIYLLFGVIRYVVITAIILVYEQGIYDYFIYQSILSITICIFYHLMLGKTVKVTFVSSNRELEGSRDYQLFKLLITTTIAYQLDKFIIYLFIGPKSLGYYSIAFSAASLPMILISSFYYYSFPKFSKLSGNNTKPEFLVEFQKDSILMVSCVFLPCIYASYYSKDILQFWLNDIQAVSASYNIFSILILGNLFQGALMIPYCASMAFSRANFMLKVNLMLIPVMVVTQVIAAYTNNVVVVAASWLLFNILFYLVVIKNLKREYHVENTRKYISESFMLNVFLTLFAITLTELVLINFDLNKMVILILLGGTFTLLCLARAIYKIRN